MNTAQENKAFITQYFQALSGVAKTPELYDQYISPGNQALRDHINQAEAAFPRYEMIVRDMIAEGDKVAVRADWRATHQGEFMGVPASGRSIDVPFLIIYQIGADGLIADQWLQVDSVALMTQIGAMPMPDAPAEE